MHRNNMFAAYNGNGSSAYWNLLSETVHNVQICFVWNYKSPNFALYLGKNQLRQLFNFMLTLLPWLCIDVYTAMQ